MNEVEKMKCDMVFVNGGGIRDNIAAGEVSGSVVKTVNPFGNQVCMVRLDGQSVLDALEFGSREAGKIPVGGFMQVAGSEKYRVHDVQVYDIDSGKYVPLDLKKSYTVCGSSFLVRAGGDGFSMLAASELVKDYIGEDYVLTLDYIKSFSKGADGLPHISSRNSPLAKYSGYLLDYENHDGSGRIILK